MEGCEHSDNEKNNKLFASSFIDRRTYTHSFEKKYAVGRTHSLKKWKPKGKLVWKNESKKKIVRKTLKKSIGAKILQKCLGSVSLLTNSKIIMNPPLGG